MHYVPTAREGKCHHFLCAFHCPVFLVLCIHNYKQYYVALKVGRVSKKAEEAKGKSNNLI